ncbi:hypothetical protein D3C85_1128150 [compost metagenome]
MQFGNLSSLATTLFTLSRIVDQVLQSAVEPFSIVHWHRDPYLGCESYFWQRSPFEHDHRFAASECFNSHYAKSFYDRRHQEDVRRDKRIAGQFLIVGPAKLNQLESIGKLLHQPFAVKRQQTNRLIGANTLKCLDDVRQSFELVIHRPEADDQRIIRDTEAFTRIRRGIWIKEIKV